MSFPNYPDKHANPALLSAQDIVDYRRRLGRFPKVQRLDGVLLCLERGLPERLRRRVPIQLVGRMMGELYSVKRSQGRVVVMTNFGGGSPVVAELAEEFVVMGARKLILLTWGGCLQPDLQAADVIVCSQALRDEGTSHHYLPPAKYIQADAALAESLAAAIRKNGHTCSIGTTWTTDAPYRETIAEVRQYQAEGVKTVEMEAAGLFTIGQVRGVQTTAAVVVMDSLATFKWQAPERLTSIQRSLEVVYTAAIEALAEGSDA